MDPIPDLTVWLNHVFPPPEATRPRAVSALSGDASGMVPHRTAAQTEADNRSAATEARWVVEAANTSLAERNIGLRFVQDEAIGHHVMQLIDEATGDVLRQIPSEEAVRLARALTGLLVNGNA
ncbi:flagellar protein FlaG [Flagellatimonas centrodinii]|uniref:flagellar protein FlaG n=1 Tax=Flagellatimonas centrodinii TaxID=2806210 RepID=UPI001FFD88A5|nr:flagellar protein FlaG [Flagellatimonas centrodinii]ULQ45621.1 flagellar protein FlaG [Flagellatimonas centrodinii]